MCNIRFKNDMPEVGVMLEEERKAQAVAWGGQGLVELCV